MEYSKISELVTELEKYAELEGSEVGEVCTYLCTLTHYIDYVSDDFRDMLVTEIQDQLANFKQNATIIEKPQTTTRTVKTLEWNE